MKKGKALFISLLIVGMLTIILIGLYALKIKIWIAIVGALVIGGLYLMAKKIYNWLLEDGPLDAVYFDTSSNEDLIPFDS